MNINQIDINCTGCQACVFTCKKECISLREDKAGFLYPVVDLNKCVDCSQCVKKCPALANNEHLNHLKKTIKPFKAVSILEERKKSSSGGIFYTLAYKILESNGVVFGAGYDENFHVKHICIELKEELAKIQGSKYVQSDTTGIYLKVKNKLEEKRVVLFSGTPCQISGLYAAIGNHWDNLITIDIICHGVPSGVLWDNYILQRQLENKLSSVSFRYKDYKNKSTFKLFFKYHNGKTKIINAENDIFYSSFLKANIFRESCYKCKYAQNKRCGDITLGDCASSISYCKNDFKPFEAVSTVLVNSAKGIMLWESIEKVLEYEFLDIEEEYRKNHQLSFATNRPSSRNDVFVKGIIKDIIDKKIVALEVNNGIINKIKSILKNLTTIKMRYYTKYFFNKLKRER